MKILLFGGTTEGRLLAHELAALKAQVTICVATDLGEEELGDKCGLSVRSGRLDQNQMETLMTAFDLCIDATHPYAVLASQNIRQACVNTKIPYRRVSRKASMVPSDVLSVSNACEAAEYLAQKNGNILLTTGAKELPFFSEIARERLYVRVLPTCESISACEKEKIPHKNILALQGPFSKELNEALLHQFSISWLVTKDGGCAGGFEEKVQAAKNTGVRMIVIRRPEDEGEDWQTILKECKEKWICT
ncbi:precorrin-6A reductase [uncultured Ruthenibacterium sp.]|uniref:precorrin-6A reductase n=1 Tax=uncultured Ruthenibacterium sp. TaxID=1905347 RepID=UPI00349EAF70